MAQPVARIRPYQASDENLVKFMVSKANFATLAVANNRVYTHPITVAIWFALSAVFVQWMSWWPAAKFGWIGYLRPLPALASTAVPIMFFVDWVNRPYFEKQAQEVLRFQDLQDVNNYYSRKPASGFWILEYGERFVGLIAIDANQESASSKASKSQETHADERTQPKTATIRHFYVEEAFRGSNIQDDLLQHGVNYAFERDPTLQRIEAFDSPLVPYLRSCLRTAGFELDHNTKKVGLLGWNMGVRYLSRNEWKGT
ncbi:hypothetical protein B0H34DRAFT_684021 [Crassisporium funariophilum]|nr:hypothetical protein B0H34DRAFT_684021 [Crassisporium funariophilum]